MKGSLPFMALAAAGLFLTATRGALADHQRYGGDYDNDGSRYQQNDWHSQRATPRDEQWERRDHWRSERGRSQDWRSQDWRSHTADRDDQRGQDRWGQDPFGYIGQTDREHHRTGNRPSFESGYGDRNGRGTYRSDTGNRDNHQSWRRGDRDDD